MSNRARLGVVVVAVAVVVVAFVALKPGDSSNNQDDPTTEASQTTPSTSKSPTRTEAERTKTGPTASVPLAPAPPREITLKDGAPVGGVKSIKVDKGTQVRLRVNTNEVRDDIHLHGYDIEKTTSVEAPAIFRFKANLEGVFEIESHTAEDAGREPLIARLVVEPD